MDYNILLRRIMAAMDAGATDSEISAMLPKGFTLCMTPRETYRIAAEDIDVSRCVGRRFSHKDTRWEPFVMKERQCREVIVDGHDLCATCLKREKAFKTNPSVAPKNGWNGRVTEEPPDFTHMLGTAWATKNCRWVGQKKGECEGSVQRYSSVSKKAAAGGSL